MFVLLAQAGEAAEEGLRIAGLRIATHSFDFIIANASVRSLYGNSHIYFNYFISPDVDLVYFITA